MELGGSVVRPKAAVPKAAWYAVVADPQGNIFAIWQADPLAMPLPEPEELSQNQKPETDTRREVSCVTPTTRCIPRTWHR